MRVENDTWNVLFLLREALVRIGQRLALKLARLNQAHLTHADAMMSSAISVDSNNAFDQEVLSRKLARRQYSVL